MRRSARTGRDSRAKWPIRGHFGCDRRPMTTSIALPPDPRPAFATAVATAVDAMSAVRPDQLAAPTPCTEFDVRTLLGHLLSVLRRVAAAPPPRPRVRRPRAAGPLAEPPARARGGRPRRAAALRCAGEHRRARRR